MEFRDYYATLGVPRTASDEEIKRAYRKLARQYHPDLNPGDKAAEARFKEVNEAHEVLGNRENRKKYDELGANWRAHEQAGAAAGGGSGAGPGGWSVHFGGGPGGARGRTMTPEEMEELFGQGDPFSDFFHTFFGGAGDGRAGPRTRGRRRQTPGRDVEQPVELTLEEAFAGTSRRLALTHDAGTKQVEVRIPAGVRDGARVRAAGEGVPSSSGGPSGDLYLRVRLAPHARFERRGDDLHTRAPMSLATAVLGGETTIQTLDGSELRLRVPELTQPGRVFRVRGRGMPIVGKSERGDLYATADVELPRTLTPETRRLFEALRAQEQEG